MSWRRGGGDVVAGEMTCAICSQAGKLTRHMHGVVEQRVVRWKLQDSSDLTWSYEEVLLPPNYNGGTYGGLVSSILPFPE